LILLRDCESQRFSCTVFNDSHPAYRRDWQESTNYWLVHFSLTY
jgi:hypothetical protein